MILIIFLIELIKKKMGKYSYSPKLPIVSMFSLKKKKKKKIVNVHLRPTKRKNDPNFFFNKTKMSL
jgi:hypothetical protein